MLIFKSATVGAAISILALLALPASEPNPPAQTPGSNVTVFTCDPHQHAPGVTHPWIGPYGEAHPGRVDFPSDEGFLAIDYRNDARNPATEVDFGLVIRETLVATAKDIGTFSKGVKIQHEFVISREIFPIGASSPFCAVLRVKYADGTEWHNPNPPPTD